MVADAFYMSASPDHVASFLGQHKTQQSVINQLHANQIDGLAFSLLTDQDLRDLNVVEISQRKRILFLSSLWQQCNEAPNFPNFTESTNNDNSSPPSSLGTGDAIDHFLERIGDTVHHHDCQYSPQPIKLIVSMIYAFIVAGITATVMVLAHERLPDMSKYPPLPDIMLSTIPHIPWAFAVSEYIAIALLLIWFTVVLFHKHRFILLRRFFAITGTVFLLRSITMIITSLSVPGDHLVGHCRPSEFTNHTDRIKRILEIWLGFGMTVSGVYTCGDYMFSGHTSMLTLLNFFITEYSPRRMQWIHTLCWVLNLFGLFFVLASHEHYSIDVFAAVYVSSRLFLYYHALANADMLRQFDRDRTMTWFPMFAYFEYDVRAMVPNVYEWPFNLDKIVAFVCRIRDNWFKPLTAIKSRSSPPPIVCPSSSSSYLLDSVDQLSSCGCVKNNTNQTLRVRRRRTYTQ